MQTYKKFYLIYSAHSDKYYFLKNIKKKLRIYGVFNLNLTFSKRNLFMLISDKFLFSLILKSYKSMFLLNSRGANSVLYILFAEFIVYYLLIYNINLINISIKGNSLFLYYLLRQIMQSFFKWRKIFLKVFSLKIINNLRYSFIRLKKWPRRKKRLIKSDIA